MEKRKSRLLSICCAAILVLVLVALGFWWFSPSQQQRRRNNALVAASTAGDVKGVQDALAGGADPNARDGNGMTPLMFAARGERPDHRNPTATDHPAVAELLLKRGANVNGATDTGFVALFWAARYGHDKVIKVLIDNGADVNAKDEDGITAMRWAVTNRAASPTNYDRVIALLKEAGAKE
jgi:ankyrin repeat protein